LGEFIKKKPDSGLFRDDLVIATKYSLPTRPTGANTGGNTRKNMMREVDSSLARLQTHYIDVYYVHFWSFSTPNVEIMRGLDDLVRCGKVNYIAISDTPAWEVSTCNTLAELQGWSKFIGYQGRYNIGDRAMEREIIPMSRKMKLGVIPWSVFGQGKYTGRFRKGAESAPSEAGEHRKGVKLTERDYNIVEEVVKISEEVGRSPSQVVLNWTLQQPGITSPLIGCTNIGQLKDNIGALEIKLNESQLSRLNAVSSFDLGFPHDFIGTSYETCPWVKFAPL